MTHLTKTEVSRLRARIIREQNRKAANKIVKAVVVDKKQSETTK